MVPDDVLVFPCRRTVMTFMSSPQPTFHSYRSKRSMALSTGLLLNKKTCWSVGCGTSWRWDWARDTTPWPCGAVFAD